MLEEIEAASHLCLDLVGAAEDVSVVLLEPPHPGEPGQGAGQLVPSKNTDITDEKQQWRPSGPKGAPEHAYQCIHKQITVVFLTEISSIPKYAGKSVILTSVADPDLNIFCRIRNLRLGS
jgi:hypothetical protein